MTLKKIEALGNPTSKDILVIATNWPEPTETLEHIRNEFPGITVIYYQLKKKEGKGEYSAYGISYEEIPKGQFCKVFMTCLSDWSRVLHKIFTLSRE